MLYSECKLESACALCALPTRLIVTFSIRKKQDEIPCFRFLVDLPFGNFSIFSGVIGLPHEDRVVLLTLPDDKTLVLNKFKVLGADKFNIAKLRISILVRE